jgi:hypothetical protein
MFIKGACRVCRKFCGVPEYAGGAQAIQSHISWGLLGLANAENIHSIKNLDIDPINPGIQGI